MKKPHYAFVIENDLKAFPNLEKDKAYQRNFFECYQTRFYRLKKNNSLGLTPGLYIENDELQYKLDI